MNERAANVRRAGADDGGRVSRRRVLYAHGFDPAPSERYRRLIAKAGADRGARPPVVTKVEPITEISEGWRIDAEIEGARAACAFEVLRYEDVVRRWRNRPTPIRMWTGFGAWARFAFKGGLRRTVMIARGPAGLFFHPILIIIGFMLLGGLAGRLIGAGFEALFGAPGWTSLLGRFIGFGVGIWASLRWERVFFGHLMLALFDFMIRIAEGEDPSDELEGRIEEFARRIVDVAGAAEAEKTDEILIVGHSLGGLVAVRALGRALEIAPQIVEGRAKIALLTLGSVAGYVACRGGPGADEFGAAAIAVASTPGVKWVDVSAPRDWFSFGLVDPLLLVDAPPLAARSPLVISAKFGKFEPDPDDRRTRFRAMGLHMKYLSAPDAKNGFDFFAVAAGPLTLEARYAKRRNSPKAKMLSV